MFREMMDALQDYASLDFAAQTALLNDRLGDLARAHGLGALAVIGPNTVLLNVRGRLRDGEHEAPAGVTLGRGAFRIDTSAFVLEGDGFAQLESILAHYEPEGDGAYVWIIPDGYMASLTEIEKIWEKHGGGYFSHESICVLNTAERPTRCRLDVYYEDTSKPSVHVEFTVEPKQSLHYRLDKLLNEDGSPLIEKDAPVSYRVTSYDTRVVVQGSRILTSGRSSEFGSFGTAIAWTPVG